MTNATNSTDTRRAQLRKGDTAGPARKALEARIAANPADIEAHGLLSRLAFEAGDRDTCLAHLQNAAARAPDDPRLHAALAGRLRHFGLTDEALAAYDRAIALAPGEIRHRADKAHLQQALGDFAAAERALVKLLKRHPHETELYRMLFIARKATRKDPLLRKMLELWKHPRLNDTGRMHLGFALASAMESLGERARVFGYLDAANAAQARLAPFDAAARARERAAILATQDGGELTPAGPEMPLRPVFIVGMPRSGTTLVEQIVARHSQATAGGEMGHALKRAQVHFPRPAPLTPLRDLSEDALAAWAADYARFATRDTGATTGVVTDKAMQTELILGLIRRGMPGARIIVVHRDPRDVALSIYRNHFAPGTHRYATSLPAIAGAIKEFRAAIAHWRTRMPEALTEIRYEDLVADPEAGARAIVDAAGLPWEDACLRSHETAGMVHTLSLAQVRKPIHAGRRQAWRKYESEMQPFIDAWGDEPWD